MSDRSDTATGMLRDEHQLILGVVDVLDETLNSTNSASHLDFDVVDSCISFFRLFADACHHGKEEDLLFPELIEHGMPGDEGPIAVMLSEHRQGRLSVRGMAEAISDARSGDERALSALRAHADDYIGLIRAHIDKEDNVLFNMADDMVLDDACRVLCDRYDLVCRRRFEGKTKDDLEVMAASLMAGQPGKA
jgi:hemerythrin-like domain-containing protein